MTRQKLTAKIKSLGASIEYRKDRDNLEHEIVADAPELMIWKCSNVHQLVVCGADGTSWNDLYQDMYERVSYGVAPCDDKDCDVCNEFR